MVLHRGWSNCLACGWRFGVKDAQTLTEWKTVVASGSALVAALSLYWYLPLASMTNSPVNWGYPRTVTGFFHDLTRGQFERIRPAESPARLAQAMGTYSKTLAGDLGWIFLPPAVLPLLRFRKMQGPVRRLMLGTCAAFVSLSLVLVYFLNPPGDRQALGLNAAYFSASYLMLCGHTHGGECDLAFFGTPFAPMKDKRYVRGLHPWKDR